MKRELTKWLFASTLLSAFIIGIIFAYGSGTVDASAEKSKPARCEVHGLELITENGFIENLGISVDYADSYAWFLAVSCEDAPNRRWAVSKTETEYCSTKVSLKYCSMCETAFNAGYDEFKKLAKNKQRERFYKAAANIRAKTKAEQAASSNR